MLNVLPMANEKLRLYLEANGNPQSCIRIVATNGEEAEEQLGLALDEVRENDRTFTNEGMTFVINEDLLISTGKILLDYTDTEDNEGFVLFAEHSPKQ